MKHHGKNRTVCDCGNVATIIKDSERICLRCYTAEQNFRKRDNRVMRPIACAGPVDTYSVSLAGWK